MGGRILLDSPNNDSMFRWLVRFLDKIPTLSRWPGLVSSVELATRRIYNPGRFYYYTAKTYSKLLTMAGFEVTEARYRQARYALAANEKLRLPVKLAMSSVAFAEKIFHKQSWVEVRGVKTRELEPARFQVQARRFHHGVTATTAEYQLRRSVCWSSITRRCRFSAANGLCSTGTWDAAKP
jgi:hypothetical protein